MLLARAVANHLGMSPDESLSLVFSFSKLSELCPELPLIRPRHDDIPHWRRPSELTRSKEEYRDSNVIFLVRDPRDVIVSLYFELSKRLPGFLDDERAALPENIRARVAPFTGSIEEFVSQDIGGFETIIEYFNIWGANRHLPKSFMIMRYEDLHANTQGELMRVLQFIGMEHISVECAAEAVQFAKFGNMRKLEAAGTIQLRALTPLNSNDQESFKTRRGVVGGYHDYLSPELAERLSQIMNARLSPVFNY